MKSKENQIEFCGRVKKEVWNSDNFKVYALDVDKTAYPNLRSSKYGNIVINGDIPNLEIESEYNIIGIEKETKNGYGYQVINIKRKEPTNMNDMFVFLSEILTITQAETLWKVYPDIIQRVKENRLDDIDFSKLKGIKEASFEKIKQKIIDNFCLSDLVINFQGYLSLSIIKRIYEKYTSLETLQRELAKDPYKCLYGLARTGFKTADKILLEMDKVSQKNISKGKPPIIKFEYDLRTSMQRCRACIIYLLEDNESNGNTKMNLVELRKECLKTVPECADKFAEAIKDKSIWYDKETLDCALQKTYNTECEIAQTIIDALNDYTTFYSVDVNKYRMINDTELSDEQLQTLSNVANNQICILNGGAGCGKSYSTQALIRMLEDNKLTYKLFAPTGKASKVLADFTKRPASTIHRGLKYNPNGFYYLNSILQNPKAENFKYDYFSHFGYNKCCKLDCDVVVVDEFSMVDIFLFKSLLDTIDFSRTKLLLIGDSSQIPSVGAGVLLHDFIQSNLIPTVTLTKVFRYNEGGLMKVATDVRNSKIYLDKNNKSKAVVFGNNKDYTFIDLPSENIPKNAVALYKKLLDKGNHVKDIQVLVAKNVGDCGTTMLNNMIQKIANPNYGSELCIRCGDTTYYKGDFVIQKVNEYKAELCYDYLSEVEKSIANTTGKALTAFVANGNTGTILDISNQTAIIDFDGTVVQYDKSQLTMIGLGYCITVHKSQGSSIDNIIVCTPKSHIFMLNSNLLYTALTRMKKKCYHLGSYSTVNQAVVKKANLERKTMMRFLLKKFNVEYIPHNTPKIITNTKVDTNSTTFNEHKKTVQTHDFEDVIFESPFHIPF